MSGDFPDLDLILFESGCASVAATFRKNHRIWRWMWSRSSGASACSML